MPRFFPIFLVLFLLAPCFGAVPVIFDTDMGNDIDDALALAMLHSLESRGECKLLGVTLTNAHPDAARYIRMVNRFYGRPEIPVGVASRAIREGDRDGFLSKPLAAAPIALRKETRIAPEPAVLLLRRLLAESEEKVVIVQVGFSTNLAALLESKADAISDLDGRELARRKVSLLSAMAGNFVETTPEYNVRLDIPAAKQVLESWPTPVLFSGFEIGRALPYPAVSIERDFSYAPWHPIAASYRAYAKMPYDRPTWDLTSVLAAVRPDRGYFLHSEPGDVTVDTRTGSTSFTPNERGTRHYLRLSRNGVARILEALTLLASEPPRGRGE